MSRVNFKVNFLFLAAGLTLGGCKPTSTKPVQPEAVFYPAKLTAIDAAIERAIDEAEPGDAVVIAGKGHETYQVVGDERRPFDDRLVARAALARRRARPRVS